MKTTSGLFSSSDDILVICSWYIWKHLLQGFAYIVVARISSVSLSLSTSLWKRKFWCYFESAEQMGEHVVEEVLAVSSDSNRSVSQSLCVTAESGRQYLRRSYCGILYSCYSMAIYTWLYIQHLEEQRIGARASGSELLSGCCFIWQEWQEGWHLFGYFFLVSLVFGCNAVARSSKATHAKPCEFSSQEGDIFI